MSGLALAVTIFMYVLNAHTPFVELRRMFFETLIYANIIAFPSYWVLPRLFLLVSKWSSFVQWTIFVCTMSVISGLGSLVGTVLLLNFRLEQGAPFWSIEWVSFRICVFIALLFGAVQATIERMKDRLRTEELARDRAIKLATEARLSSLEARLHPHFLFNTLNSISSLIPADPVRAERLVERMAALLRFSLAQPGGLVPLEQEIKIVRDYLEIEKARLGERLQFRIEVSADVLELAVPPLSIQTLVENSIKYAVAPNREGGEIDVRANREDGFLCLDVRDTGPGFTFDTIPSGHGLDNLQARLTALFGNSAALTVSQRNGTVVRMRVPT